MNPIQHTSHLAMRAVPTFNDLSAMWPSKSLGGAVHLHAAGAWASPLGSGVCRAGQVVEIDRSWPLYARWTGREWAYLARPIQMAAA